jgi:hypothetical protein
MGLTAQGTGAEDDASVADAGSAASAMSRRRRTARNAVKRPRKKWSSFFHLILVFALPFLAAVGFFAGETARSSTSRQPIQLPSFLHPTCSCPRYIVRYTHLFTQSHGCKEWLRMFVVSGLADSEPPPSLFWLGYGRLSNAFANSPETTHLCSPVSFVSVFLCNSPIPVCNFELHVVTSTLRWVFSAASSCLLELPNR